MKATTGTAAENRGCQVEATRDLPHTASSAEIITTARALPGSPSAPAAESALARFSKDRIYRYVLWRDTENLFPAYQGYVNFVMLNPSTADERADDPTIRRCVEYARTWGYLRLCVTNLFAYRSADVRRMLLAKDPVGEDNNMWIAKIAADAAMVVVAWGIHGAHRGRAREVLSLLPEVHCLAENSDSSPVHPLYQRKSLHPRPYRRP